jgi:hypothetical protein
MLLGRLPAPDAQAQPASAGDPTMSAEEAAAASGGAVGAGAETATSEAERFLQEIRARTPGG